MRLQSYFPSLNRPHYIISFFIMDAGDKNNTPAECRVHARALGRVHSRTHARPRSATGASSKSAYRVNHRDHARACEHWLTCHDDRLRLTPVDLDSLNRLHAFSYRTERRVTEGQRRGWPRKHLFATMSSKNS